MVLERDFAKLDGRKLVSDRAASGTEFGHDQISLKEYIVGLAPIKALVPGKHVQSKMTTTIHKGRKGQNGQNGTEHNLEIVRYAQSSSE
jgi:hypothetical protein